MFGFIAMTPQLYVNYKLKSVAHMPWRAFMYKTFNTFIDDVFAFAVTMPLIHRIGKGLSQSPRSASAIAHTRTRRDYYLCPYKTP